jgi:hypothetical protein
MELLKVDYDQHSAWGASPHGERRFALADIP